jgi:Ca2+-binding RTX toxin-like protein
VKSIDNDPVDFLDGDPVDDYLSGGEGDDTLHGDDGDDIIFVGGINRVSVD